MKIGIVTFQWADNYGAVLQAFALQTYLLAKGHEVEILDYRPPIKKTVLKKWVAKTPKKCLLKWEEVYKAGLFESFRKKFFKRTLTVFRTLVELTSVSDQFDILITGSDQVWNPKWLVQFDEHFEIYFLSFAGNKTRRISYAASLGHSRLDTMEVEWREILSEKLKQMDAISVREFSGVRLVEDLSGRTDAIQVVDPTLLLGRSQYEKIIQKPLTKSKKLFSYMLHGLDNDATVIIRQLVESYGSKIEFCNAKSYSFINGYVLPSPTRWLAHIRDAGCVITNSFHATVFCLIFHVPFFSMLIEGNNSSMNSRIIELLEAVGLQHRICSPSEQILDELIDESINWDNVDQRLIQIRESALIFLKDQGLG